MQMFKEYVGVSDRLKSLIINNFSTISVVRIKFLWIKFLL